MRRLLLLFITSNFKFGPENVTSKLLFSPTTARDGEPLTSVNDNGKDVPLPDPTRTIKLLELMTYRPSYSNMVVRGWKDACISLFAEDEQTKSCQLKHHKGAVSTTLTNGSLDLLSLCLLKKPSEWPW